MNQLNHICDTQIHGFEEQLIHIAPKCTKLQQLKTECISPISNKNCKSVFNMSKQKVKLMKEKKKRKVRKERRKETTNNNTHTYIEQKQKK